MKKIIYSILMLSLVFTACDPLEDVYNEVGSVDDTIVGDATITLTNDDYDLLDLGRYYFDSEDEAKEALPSFISELYPVWGAGSSVVVNYNLNNEVSVSSYTVTDADYSDLGLTYFDSEGDFESFFSFKYPNVTDKGSVVYLTYNAVPEIVNYELTDADYELVGNGRFDNFDIRSGAAEESIEVRREKIQTILLNNFPDNVPGVIYEVTYATYDGSVGQDTMQVVLTDNSPTDVAEYTLENADYELVGNGRYYNFDIRPGRAEESIEVRREKIETILLNNFPASVEGDFYLVTYAIYDGAAGTREMLLRFDGTNWNIFTALTYEFYTFAPVETTSTFVYTSEWSAPYEVTDEDYAQMGQRFNNFDGRSEEARAEALRLLEVFLGQKYPFASVDQFLALEYKSFTGSGNDVVIANFVFDGNSWNAVPLIIETSLQFGFEDGQWVPDNTIKYTLTNADYALVGNDRYNNFDIRPGRNEESIEVRLEKINTILLNNFPDLEEGQKFLVTYNIYNGSNGVLTMSVIKEGEVYILNE